MVGLQSKVMVYHFDTDENKTEIYQNIKVSGSLYLCHSFDGKHQPGKGKSRRKRERYREAELKKNPSMSFDDERIGKVISVDHTSSKIFYLKLDFSLFLFYKMSRSQLYKSQCWIFSRESERINKNFVVDESSNHEI